MLGEEYNMLFGIILFLESIFMTKKIMIGSF